MNRECEMGISEALENVDAREKVASGAGLK